MSAVRNPGTFVDAYELLQTGKQTGTSRMDRIPMYAFVQKHMSKKLNKRGREVRLSGGGR